MAQQYVTECVCKEEVISPSVIGDLSATKAGESPEKDMITGQSGTRWPCPKRVHRKPKK